MGDPSSHGSNASFGVRAVSIVVFVLAAIAGQAEARSVAFEAAPGAAKEALVASLIPRLLEDGYLLVPRREQAAVVLSVSTSSLAIQIGASGVRRSESRIDLSNEISAVDLLEAQHRALLAVERAGLAKPRRASPDVISLRWMSEPPEDGASLDAALAIAVLDAGFGVAQLESAHQRELCLEDGQDAVELAVARRGECEGTRRRTIHANAGELRDRFHRRIAKIAASMITVREAPVPVVKVQDSLHFELGLFGGGLVASEPALFAALALTLAPRDGLGGSALLSIAPSSAGGEGFILEALLGVGPSLRLPIASELDLVTSLIAGARLHAFSITGARSGTRLDWTALGLVEVDYRWSSELALCLGALGGLSGASRAHRLDGTEIWSREAWMASILAGVRYSVF
jgi:hypothetical protein